jgi:AraC-like DNA-binding protein
MEITLKESAYSQKWRIVAQQVDWSVTKLAKHFRVSVRKLEYDFLETVGRTPKAWLTEQRQKKAMKFLRNGISVKETAFRLNYKHGSTFSREFKKYWGRTPSDAVRPATNRLKQLA